MLKRTTRKLVKVPLYGQPAGKVAKIEDGATQGATIGSDLFFADGSVVTLANLAAALGTIAAAATPSSGVGPLSRTLWSLIQEIPANIVEAAALNTVGLVTRQTSGDWITRAIAVASTDRLTIANGDGDAGAPTLDLADLEGLSLWGRSLTSTGKPDAITGTANQVARVNSAGTLLGFGAVNLASSDAVTGRLPFANVAQITGQAVLGVATAGAGDLAAISAGTNDRLLAQTAGALGFVQLAAGMFPSTLTTTSNFAVASLGINIAAPGVGGRVRADGATPEYRLSRSTGTASDWQAYLPAGSTDYRFFSGADRFVFAADGTMLVLGNALFVGEASFPSLTSTRGYLSANGSASATMLLRVGSVTQGYLFGDATDFYVTTPAASGNNLRLQTVDVDRIVISGADGSATFSTVASGLVYPIFLSSGTPGFAINETDGATDNKLWDFIVSGEALNFRTKNDAGSSAASWLVVQRTGITVDSITFDATTVAVSSKDLVVGNATQLNATANRGTLTVNGASTAIYSLATGGTRRAYLFTDGTELTLDNTQAGSLVLACAGVARLTITTDGRIYGSALHNNAGSMTGTTNQYIGSGTYTPTASNLTNLDSVTGLSCNWIRVGNIVHVTGGISADPTAAGTCILTLSLPIASNLAAQTDCAGNGIEGTNLSGLRIDSDSTNDGARFIWVAPSGSAATMFFVFSYRVL